MKNKLTILMNLGCREGQGYYYSKPTSPDACEQFMRKSSKRINIQILVELSQTFLWTYNRDIDKGR